METRARRPLLPVMTVAFLLLLTVLTLMACSVRVNVGNGDEGEVKTYSDPDYGYSFAYPADWELEKGDSSQLTGGSSSAGGVGVYDPDGAVVDKSFVDLAQVSVYELNVVVEESMLPDVKPEVEAVLADLVKQDPSWTAVEALSDATVGGVPGYTTTYSFAINDSTQGKCTFYFLFDGDIEYQLTVQAASKNWEENQATFAAIVASFKPGTGQ